MKKGGRGGTDGHDASDLLVDDWTIYKLEDVFVCELAHEAREVLARHLASLRHHLAEHPGRQYEFIN